ncbi:MAG: hypothetical protein K2J40_05965 [Ruminococcus sp.]|nr:hypothetical protein [Ruminococcus sp.]
MSWIRCYCGYKIHDSSDHLSYKGRIMSDQDYFDYLDSVSSIIGSECPDRKKLVDNFYFRVPDMTKTVYQCSQCGRLYIEEDNKLFCFKPENHTNNGVLKSVHGEKWKGFLYAEWRSEKYEWQEYKGYVCADVNYPCESIYSDDRQEIIDGYYRLLEELKKAGVIRSASLKINGERIHDWTL